MAERLIIRPPSEWQSALIRMTRGCKWNRCRFCGIYPSLGEPGFSVRSLEEVKKDIDEIADKYPQAETAFIGDSDPLQSPIEDFITIVKYIREKFTNIHRITCYARASTLCKLKEFRIKELAAAGLARVHIGLESGDMETLRFHKKGISPQIIIESSEWLKRAGIEISFYVLLGLGGRDRWKEHMDATADVINKVKPEFIRIRRLGIFSIDTIFGRKENPLCEDISEGRFIEQTPEGTVLELRRLIEKLDSIPSQLMCDHSNNYVQVSGSVDKDRKGMLEIIDDFLSQSKEQKERHYKITGFTI